MQLERFLDAARIHVAGGDALAFDAQPSIAFAGAVFLQVQLIVVVLAEAGHRGELLLHALEEVEQRLAVMRQVQLGTQPHVDVEVFAERPKRIRHTGSPDACGTDSPRIFIGRSAHPSVADRYYNEMRGVAVRRAAVDAGFWATTTGFPWPSRSMPWSETT